MKLKGFLLTVTTLIAVIGFSFVVTKVALAAPFEHHEVGGSGAQGAGAAAANIGRAAAGGGVKEAGTVIEAKLSEKISKPQVDFDSVANVGASFLIFLTGDPDLGEPGAIASTGKAMAMIYGNAPASGSYYVADLLESAKMSVAPPAYAQGVGGLGFSSLEPILEGWKQFRNIAYLFFIIVTLVVGFMIMMRQKVGGQAAVTAQQAIPNIVIALIAVTFSYAIAGFLIDMMYLFMYMLIGLLPGGSAADINKNIFQLGLEIYKGGDIFANSFSAVSTFVDELTGSSGGAASELLGLVAGLTFAIIIAFAYLFAMVSLFFELLKTYVAIILNILLSPLLLMMGALPGRRDVFSGWVKSIVGNLVAYPTVLILLLVHDMLTSTSAIEGGFMPPYMTSRSGASGSIGALVGLAIMLIAKELVVQAKKSVNPAGSGIFEQFGNALKSAVSKGWKGGQLVPGVGFTDTTKIPGVGKYLGSGQKIATYPAGLLGGALGAAGGAGLNLYRRRVSRSPAATDYRTAAARGAVRGAAAGGSAVGSDVYNLEKLKNAQKTKQGSSTH